MKLIIGDNNKVRGVITNLQAIGCNDMTFDETHTDKTIIQNEAVSIEPTKVTRNVPLVDTNYAIIDHTTSDLQEGKMYIVSDTVPCTFTIATLTGDVLPGVSTSIYSRCTDIITLNSLGGYLNFYYNGADVTSIVILPGEQLTMFNDGIYLCCYGIKKPRLFTGATPPTFAETDDIYIAT